MGIVHSIKKGFGVASSSLPLVSILFTFGLIWNLISIFVFPNHENPTVQESLVMLAATIFFVLLMVFVQGGSMSYVRDRLKLGSSDLSSFVTAGRKYYLRYFGVGLVISAIVLGCVIIAGVLAGLLGERYNILGLALAVTVVGLGVYVVILMFLAPYILVADEEKVIAAIRHSISTVRKNLLSILGLFLLLILIGFVFGIGVGLIYALFPGAQEVILAVLSSLVNAFLGVVVTASFMNFYLELSSASGD